MQGRLTASIVAGGAALCVINACANARTAAKSTVVSAVPASDARRVTASRAALRLVTQTLDPSREGARPSPHAVAKPVAGESPVPLRAGLSIGMVVIGDKRGDYEAFLTVASVSSKEVVVNAMARVAEVSGGEPRDVTYTREIRRRDLDSASVQVLGFHAEYPRVMPGTTALGTSSAVLMALRTTGRATYGLTLNENETHVGTITRVGSGTEIVSVLLNGRRVSLRAIQAAGQLSFEGRSRPWELWFLDDAANPILLKVARGRIGSALPVVPTWRRQIVRIDVPDAPENRQALENALAKDCRVEIPGIYFDFNSTILNQASQPALRGLGDLLTRRAEWRVVIEGHTDSIGTDVENRLLSAKRAAAVRDALISQHRIAAERLTAAGLGELRPRESDGTAEGRARNRRVELVRTCAK